MKSKVTIVIAALIFSLYANAQWKETGVLKISMGQAYTMLSSENKVYIGTNEGVYFSSNNGTSFVNITSGVLKNKNIRAVAVSGKNLIVGTLDAGLFISSDNKTWKEINTGITSLKIQAILTNGKYIYVGTKNGLFISENNGINWKAINNGLSNLDISTIAVNGTNLYVGTFSAGVFTSTDNGNNWTAINGNLKGQNLMTKVIATSGSNIYLVNFEGVFLSTDNGSSWKDINSNIENVSIKSILINSNHIIVGATHGDLFVTSNNGISWDKVSLGSEVKYSNPGTTTTSLAISGANIFATQDSGGLLWARPIVELFK